ncbi:MAG TPA: hypothetical protein VLB47_01275 [Solirubrobacteraceae bacterium]|nr:hypothetical protein [Solirubrobacteraceae bacterium]
MDEDADTQNERAGGIGVSSAIALGAITGLVLGLVVSLATDLSLAPEAGLAVGALVGWLARRNVAAGRRRGT